MTVRARKGDGAGESNPPPLPDSIGILDIPLICYFEGKRMKQNHLSYTASEYSIKKIFFFWGGGGGGGGKLHTLDRTCNN